MNVLALNTGSNTLRFKLVGTDPEKTLADGMADHVKGPAAVAAARKALDESRSHRIDAIAVRVVHGGPDFARPVVVTPEVRAKLEMLKPLAPLHLPTGLAILDAAAAAAPGVRVFAAFDTAFHATLPDLARRYALPDLGPDVRRYGFHGFAHGYVAAEVKAPRLISLHLGGGASACAVRDGRSVDVTMGLTPLEGLMMSTRCGDLDPGLVLHLLRSGRSADDLERLLYKESGLLGVSGTSDDIRDLQPAAAAGDARAELALAMYAYRVRKQIGAYAAALGGVDAVAVSGALAENSAPFRRRVLSGLGFLNVTIDDAKNQAAGPDAPAQIQAPGSIPVHLVPADEERQMARAVVAETGTLS